MSEPAGLDELLAAAGVRKPTTEELGEALLEAMVSIEKAERLLARVQGCTCEPTVSFKQGAWPPEWKVSHAACVLAGRWTE